MADGRVEVVDTFVYLGCIIMLLVTHSWLPDL